MLRYREKALDEVLDLVEDWMSSGGHRLLLPVIDGKLLSSLKELCNERRTDNCDMCSGTGELTEGVECEYCRPLPLG